jgi:hypothetical protein
MIHRKDFIKMSALTVLAVLNSRTVGALPFGGNVVIDNELLSKLVASNELAVSDILKLQQVSRANFSRRVGQNMAKLAAAWVSPTSNYYHKAEVTEAMLSISNLLLEVQSLDGTVSIGNLESPPDTAFLLESLTSAAFFLKTENEANQINQNLKTFLLKSGEGLVTGGVHTPNHRWVICAALAKLNRLYPNKHYVARIDEWLAEGVFIDKDGHYPERSGIYSNVENNAFITISRLLNRPNLLEPVKRNLQMMYYYMEPNGDLVTTDSRRQDQYTQENIIGYYTHYRYIANYTKDDFYASVAATIEKLAGFEKRIIAEGLYHFLDNTLLQQTMIEAPALTVDYVKLFATSSLLRIRRKDTTATLFGGTDKPIQIASGRSNSPNIFSYRKGEAILKYLRLSTSFFSTGYFYSDGISKQENKFVLQSKLAVPYYQPLPKAKQNAIGDYTLSPSIDDRFWNKMDFKNRPVSNVKTLETKVVLSEHQGNCSLEFSVNGLDGVQVTIELCFKEGGTLNGSFQKEGNNHLLENGTATYQIGNSQITFGPGRREHNNIKNLEGERYSTHFGNLRTEGTMVYITGITPFKHTLQFS